MTIDNASEIAALNDLFRTGVNPSLGKWLITRGIQSLTLHEQFTIMQRVRGFTAFCEDNDPHGERDFGNFDHAGQRIFWKIDYYNRTMDGGSEDPADPFKTRRVLTIMLASEY